MYWHRDSEPSPAPTHRALLSLRVPCLRASSVCCLPIAVRGEDGIRLSPMGTSRAVSVHNSSTYSYTAAEYNSNASASPAVRQQHITGQYPCSLGHYISTIIAARNNATLRVAAATPPTPFCVQRLIFLGIPIHSRYHTHIQGASLRGRHTPPATLAQEGKIVWSGRRECPCLIVSANWRLENAKSPAAMLQENNPQTPHACHEDTANV